MRVSFQRSRHVRPTSSSRVRFRAAEVTRILSQSGACRGTIARSAGVGTSIQADQARPSRKQNPAGGAPRRGDCGPYAEGRVHLRSGQLARSCHQRGWRSVRFATLEPRIRMACLICLPQRVAMATALQGSASAGVRPERDAGVLRDAQRLGQVRLVENVPEPADDRAVVL
jgi:hypothetical protein